MKVRTSEALEPFQTTKDVAGGVSSHRFHKVSRSTGEFSSKQTARPGLYFAGQHEGVHEESMNMCYIKYTFMALSRA